MNKLSNKIMKITLLFFLAATLFFSCSKENNNPDPSQSILGSISYKVNGELMSMNNENLSSGEGVVFAKQLKGTAIQTTRYLLNAQKGTNNVFTITIVTDTLQKKSYQYDSTITYDNILSHTFGVIYNGQLSVLFFDSDNFKVNITSYSNGKISGTFSGKFSPLGPVGSIPDINNRGSVVITDGKLNNIPVTY